MDRSHPFRTLAAATGLVVLFAATALIFEAYWGVGVFVSAVVALFALVEVVGQKINPHRSNHVTDATYQAAVEKVQAHVETVDEVARFDEDWDRACRMVDRWLEEDEGNEEGEECGIMCTDLARHLLLTRDYTTAICLHGVWWKLDRHSNPPVLYSGARFAPDRLVELP